MANKYSIEDIEKMVNGKTEKYTIDDVEKMVGKTTPIQPVQGRSRQQNVSNQNRPNTQNTTQTSQDLRPGLNDGALRRTTNENKARTQNRLETPFAKSERLGVEVLYTPEGSPYLSQKDVARAEAKNVVVDADKFLADGYKMSDAEKVAAKEYAQKYLDEYNKGMRNRTISSDQQIADMSNPDSQYMKMSRLLNKTKTGSAIGAGILDSTMRGLDALGISDLMEKAERKITGNDNTVIETLKDFTSDSEDQNKLAYGAGYMATEALKSSAVADALGKTKAFSTLQGKAKTPLGKSAINVLGDLGVDTLLETAPNAVRDIREGKSAEEVAKNAAKNIGMNAAFNVIGEAAQLGAGAFLKKSFKEKTALSDAVSDVVKKADEVVKTPTLQTELIDSGAKQIDEFLPAKEAEANFLDEIAESTQKVKSIPKSQIPKTSKLAKMDNDITKLVKWYGDENTVYDLERLRSVMVDFENTGSMELLSEIGDITARIDKGLQGKKYTYPDTYSKNGSLKRKGATYKYGDNMSVESVLDDALPSFDEIYSSKASVESKPDFEVLEPVKKEGLRTEAETPVYGGGTNNNYAKNTVENFNGKVSKTRTNTMPGTGFLSDEELATKAPEHLFQYVEVHEKETLRDAMEMIQKEGAENTESRLVNKENLTAVDADALMSLWDATIKKAQAYDDMGMDSTRLWEQSNRIFKKVQTEGSNNGQFIQALAKWSRTTPAGMLAEAEAIINNGILPSDKSVKTMSEKLFEKYSKGRKTFEITPEFQKAFLAIASKFETIQDMDSREAKELMAKLGKLINDQIPVKIGEKVKTKLFNNMLGNFRTLISRNAGGNIGFNAVEQFITKPLAAGIDSLASLKTGERTLAGISKGGIKDYTSGFAGGLSDEIADLRTGLRTARSGENTLLNAARSNRRVFDNPLLNFEDTMVKFGMSVGDRPFYEGAYKQTYGDLYRLREAKKLSKELQEASDTVFDAYAKEAANISGLAAVYQDDTLLSKGMQNLKQGLADVSRGIVGVDVLSQASMPFVKTPANVVSRGIEYSPLGFVKNAANTVREAKNGGVNQMRLAQETARNIVGTGVVGGGALMARNGLMSGSYSEDKDMKNAQKAAGMQEFAIDTGDGYVSVDWIPVLGSSVIAGAAAYDKAQKDPKASLAENLLSASGEGINQLLGQSMFQGMNRVFGGTNGYSTEGLVSNVKNAAMSGLGQLVPSSVRQIANIVDPYERETYNTNLDPNIAYAISGIPYLREKLLQAKVNNEGDLVETNQGRGIGSKIFENMLSPAKYTEKVDSAVNNEAMRLFEETGENIAFLPTATRNDIKTKDGEKPTDEAFFDYRKNLGTLNSNEAEKFISSDFYKTLSDKEKAEVLQDLYSGMKVVAKKEALPDYTSTNKLAKVYEEYGSDTMQNYLEADSDLKYNEGVTMSSASWREARRAINHIEGLSDEEKGRLFRIRKNDNTVDKIFSKYGNAGISDYYDTLYQVYDPAKGNVSSEDFIPYLQGTELSDEKKGDYLIYSGCANVKTEKMGDVYKNFGSAGVFQYKAATSTDYNGDGSLKKQDLINYLNSQNISPMLKAYIFRTRYPKAKYNPYD